MLTTTTRRGRLAVVGMMLAAIALVTAGCTGNAKPGSSAPTPSATSAAASTTPTVDPSSAAAIQSALAAYQGYFSAYAAATTVANPDDANLARYAGGLLLSSLRLNLRNLKSHGAIELGHPTTAVTSTKADLTGAPPTVTIQACVDYSDYRLVYQANQSPVPNSSPKLPRFTTTATVELFTDGRWLVSQDTPHRDTPC
jgi:hypothetical protein